LVLTISRAGVAFADINGQISAVDLYDDNLFRAVDGKSFPGYSRHDDVYTLGGGGTLNLNKEHFQLNATGEVGENWYTKNSFLNSLSYDATVELTGRQKFVDLDIQAAQSQAQSSFADVRTPLKNLQSLSRTAARVAFTVTSDVRLVFDAKFNRDTNSNAVIAQADYNQPVIGVGAGYFSPSGNSIVLEEQRTYTQGASPQYFILNNSLFGSKTNFVDDTTMIQLTYAPSAVIGLFAQAGYLQRADNSILHNNTNTPVGLLRLSYTPDSVASMSISAGRQLSSQSYLLSSGITDNYAKVSPALTFPNGLRASVDFSYDQRNYGVIPQFAAIESNSSDDTIRYSAALSYPILDNYAIAISGYHEERRSSTVLDTYNDNGVMFTLTIRSARPQAPPEGLEKADRLLLP